MWGYYYNKAEKIVYYTNSDESEHVVMSELCDNVTDFDIRIDTSDYVFEKMAIQLNLFLRIHRLLLH